MFHSNNMYGISYELPVSRFGAATYPKYDIVSPAMLPEYPSSDFIIYCR
jgi:hypothetical protein